MAESAAVSFDLRGPANFGDYILIRDEKAIGALGGTFTSGAWRTRDLNTIVTDETGNVTLSSNQFTLQAGTYRIDAHAPAFNVNGHQSRLRNITDGITQLVGRGATSIQSSIADTASQQANIKGQFTLSSAKAFELQHFCTTTRATSGFGIGITGTGEIAIFTEVEIIKVA